MTQQHPRALSDIMLDIGPIWQWAVINFETLQQEKRESRKAANWPKKSL